MPRTAFLPPRYGAERHAERTHVLMPTLFVVRRRARVVTRCRRICRFTSTHAACPSQRVFSIIAASHATLCVCCFFFVVTRDASKDNGSQRQDLCFRSMRSFLRRAAARYVAHVKPRARDETTPFSARSSLYAAFFYHIQNMLSMPPLMPLLLSSAFYV
jgi:hypothetical protein